MQILLYWSSDKWLSLSIFIPITRRYSDIFILFCSVLSYQFVKKKSAGWVWWLLPVIPALWEAEVGGTLQFRSSKPAWPTWWNPLSTENTKISQVWWCAPVVPATPEAEAGESLEPGRRRLHWAENHTTGLQPWWQNETPSQKQNKTKTEQIKPKVQKHNMCKSRKQ